MNEICRVCARPSAPPIFHSHILDRQVAYYECIACGYVQTQHPDWLEIAYQQAINNSDTGIMLRNQLNVGMVLATLFCIKRRHGLVVDCAGGYGILVRMLRDKGVDARWSDPYCSNLFAIGFQHSNEHADLVTAFEAFEHFVDPLGEAERLFSIAPNLLISTELIETPTPNPEQWWYYGLDHGQHIGFFRKRTLQFIAARFGKHLTTNGRSHHLFTDIPISSFQWNFATKTAVRYPSVFTRGLQSKVWGDHQKLSTLK